MAEALVESLADDFEPEKYHDDYREQVLDLIERKAAGEEFELPETPAEKPKVVDLMAALEASVEAAKDAPASAIPPAAARREAKAEEDGEAVGAQERVEVDLSRWPTAASVEAVNARATSTRCSTRVGVHQGRGDRLLRRASRR